MMSKPMDIVVSEVGPRDGLQILRRTMPTEAKLRWITALAKAGLSEIEVGSCVHPGLLPHMADAEAVIAGARSIPGLAVLALVPNLRGAERAQRAGAHRVTVPVSASRAHSRSNINMTPEEAVEQVAQICRFRDGLGANERFAIEVGLSTAFGCTLEGSVDEGWVITLAEMCARAGADSVGLSDSVGYANPAQVRRMFRALHRSLGDKAGGAHFHNTRGLGLANVVAAIEAGVTTFDASQGGMGGCPYAPGATGNIVTEDLVFMLEAMGLRTGIDIDALMAARIELLGGLPDELLYGYVPAAGLPKGFSNGAHT
ncbi:Hydroxymethylglutaryl-CoA lyase YngG [Hyphomicrobiales bacterium]|nr:Hydroxymethylglutaryl-CoA lyase YngG [Hyphomicrobiales bacterium]CAH1693483.1 Hydroxymethylglutaryl-CoA lyase YngG [Hyphomicrobiales bacterium]